MVNGCLVKASVSAGFQLPVGVLYNWNCHAMRNTRTCSLGRFMRWAYFWLRPSRIVCPQSPEAFEACVLGFSPPDRNAALDNNQDSRSVRRPAACLCGGPIGDIAIEAGMEHQQYRLCTGWKNRGLRQWRGWCLTSRSAGMESYGWPLGPSP